MASIAPAAGVGPANQHDRAFLGHPRGLGFLVFAEAWERFSFYGMQTLLVLYMVDQLLKPGHIENVAGFPAFQRFLESYNGALSGQALASAVFGFYAAGVYLTPIAGGFIADRVLGRTRTIALGAILMALGHFAMAFDWSFIIALLLLLAGVGCFKGNIAAQVGELYGPDDNRRADAFQLYYLGINGAVIISPLVCGTLGQKVGWHWGFGAAGIGMLLGLIIYLSGRRWLPADRSSTRTAAAEKPHLTGDEKKRVAILVLLIPVLAAGLIGNQEIFNAYLVWGERTYNFTFFGITIPSTWLIMLDAALSVSCLIGAMAFWRWYAKRWPEPNELTKICIGAIVSVTGALSLTAAASLPSGDGKISLAWAFLFHLLNSIGFANILPVSLALYARAAPARLAATMIGIYYLLFFFANLAVGRIGGLLDTMADEHFWLLHAAILAGAAAALLVIRALFGGLMAAERD